MVDGDDERTTALGLFNTARSYWQSAEHLSAAHLKVTHPQAPITFLFCHAIELYLKAYLRGTGKDIGQLKQLGHRVANLAKSAIKSGLVIGPEHSETLDHIDDADVAIEARYIVTGFKTVPTNEALSNVAGVLDETICTALARAGIPVRAEQFTRPPLPQQQSSLGHDTTRVLVHIFRSPTLGEREVRAMSLALQLQRSVLQYHLDCLNEAGLADIASGNVDGSIYWTLTPQGRRYVVDQKLT
jgi:DNA-binding transcriptional ArsR family regulator